MLGSVVGLASCGGVTSHDDSTPSSGSSNVGGASVGGGGTGGASAGGRGGASPSEGGTSCIAAGEALLSRLSTATCTLTLRVDYGAQSILGYQVSCGDEVAVSAASALEPLLFMSSVDWGASVLVSDPTTTGVYAFESGESEVLYVASARTGEQLAFAYLGGGGYSLPADWLDGGEIDGSCPNADEVAVASFGPIDSSFAPETASRLLARRGLFAALQERFGAPYDTVGAARVDLTDAAEYLVIVTVSPRV